MQFTLSCIVQSCIQILCFIISVCYKVCQWIAGKVASGSTPSTSPVPCPSPSSSDWIRSHSDRASPVRSSYGKNTPSTSSQGSGGGSQSEQTNTPKSRSEKHTDMAELAKHVREVFDVYLKFGYY